METEESWVKLHEFPDYLVSDRGQVIRIGADKPMSINYTQHGHPKLNLVNRHGERCTRSVSLMVAQAWVEPEYQYCDHVIVKDMDYTNLCADNLAWRPDGFAWEYAHQFKSQPPLHFQNLPVEDVEHGVRYKNIIEAAISQGLLLKDIWRSTYTGETTFPTLSIFVI